MKEGEMCLFFGVPADPDSLVCQVCLMGCRFAGRRRAEDVVIPVTGVPREELMRK
jgi:hypothetical protein